MFTKANGILALTVFVTTMVALAAHQKFVAAKLAAKPAGK